MTQQEIDKYFEERNLVFKDLCGRIPYHVRVQLDDNKFPDPFGTHNLEHFWGYTIVKPYLFPLSSMTEEQKNDCPIGETNLNIIISNIGCYGIIEIPWKLSYLFVDWCNKNHFDYRGLIPMYLAIDATGLNIY